MWEGERMRDYFVTKEHNKKYNSKRKYKTVEYNDSQKEIFAIHTWLRYYYQKANFCENISCDKKSETYDWAKLRDKPYEKNINSFVMLCKKCHYAYDKNETSMDIKHNKRVINIIPRRNMREYKRDYYRKNYSPNKENWKMYNGK